MATREISKDPKRKKKEVLQEVPIKYFASSLEGVVPDIPGHENLPPLQLASYITVTPTFMPQISFQQIYQHMILRKTTDGKEVNNHRGLDRAIKHFEAGDISQVMIAQIDDSVDYIRGSCLASMKKIKYHVYICVENKQKVCFAYCECPIGLAQSCSHIGGLLFYIHHLQLSEKLMSDSATSKSCQWNVPRPMKMEPKPLKDWNLSRPKLSSEGQVEFREKKQIDFDPRHPDQREFQLAHSIEQLKILKKIFPKTGELVNWI
ncbi:uncharacterized protein LOC133203981 [Saccostrea echinata]|uniref:uncharacterized protein LOC133203981 n=1 Tax=Saccostrea echinata TaxID=191078 RepID=UPI002A814FB5|nr:uncharacterized protein LOC133203981 [Saccostrea echinata]